MFSTHRPRRRRRWPVLLVAVLAVTGAAALLAYRLTVVPELAAIQEATVEDLDLASIAYTADGKELARYYRTHRLWAGYHTIAPTVVHALIATEDHRFYDHRGIDVVRLGGSAWQTLRGRRQGGSTITMQLARNLVPEVGREITPARKLREMVAALKLERRYAKHEILEMYLNTVPFGYRAFGIEAAAQTYFGTSARTLDVLQSATLVGLLKGPSWYNPVRHPDRARARRNLVLALMVRHGYLEPDRLDSLQAAPLAVQQHAPAETDDLAPHFAAYVRTWLEAWADANGYNLYTDGLRIHTTLDSELQELAEAAVAAQLPGLQAVAAVEWSRARTPELGDTTAPYTRALEHTRPFAHFWATHPEVEEAHIRETARFRRLVEHGTPEAGALATLRTDRAFMDSLRAVHTRLETGLVALDPHTGRVKAWVGGRDFSVDQYDHVAQARRQPGSTFKPFVYAAAIDRGLAPDDSLQDARTTFAVDDYGATWTPRNAGAYSGRYVTLRDGLAWSKNTLSAQLIAAVGPERVASLAEAMGIRSPLARVPSLALGTSEVTLLELATAYGALAAGGVHQPPVVVTRIDDRNGHPIAVFDPDGTRALSRYTAYTVLDMMRDVVQRGTGIALRSQFGIDADVAGKTGTTQHHADGWFLAVHPRLVVGAWVGFNDRRLAFRSDTWGQGSRTALPVVGDFLRRALDAPNGYHATARFAPPPGYRPPRPAVTSLEAVPVPTPPPADAPDPSIHRDAFAEGLMPPPRQAPVEADPEAVLRHALGEQ